MNWFTTNSSLRREVKQLQETIKKERDNHYQAIRRVAKLEAEQRNLLRQIEFLKPTKVGSGTPVKAPNRAVERAKKGYAVLPTSNPVLRPAEDTVVRQEDNHNSVNSFLAGAVLGAIFASNFESSTNDSTSSNSSSSDSSSDSFSSGGGGDFGGGGASSDW